MMQLRKILGNIYIASQESMPFIYDFLIWEVGPKQRSGTVHSIGLRLMRRKPKRNKEFEIKFPFFSSQVPIKLTAKFAYQERALNRKLSVSVTSISIEERIRRMKTRNPEM